MYTVIQINGNTWQIEDMGVRFFLLVGREKALMIDSGMTRPDARKMAESLTDLPIELINTHADRDHIAGNGSFDWFYMHPSEASNYYHGSAQTMEFRPVYDGDMLDLGDREIEVVALPGHTPGSIALLDRKARMLFSGDPIQDGSIFMFGIQREMHAYIHSLRRLETRIGEFDAIYPSHGTCPVQPGMIGKMITGAEGILAGKFTGEDGEMFGQPIRKYDTGAAVFLCDRV